MKEKDKKPEGGMTFRQQVLDIIAKHKDAASSKKERAVCKKILKEIRALPPAQPDSGNPAKDDVVSETDGNTWSAIDGTEPDDMDIATNTIGLWWHPEIDAYTSQAISQQSLKALSEINGNVRAHIVKNPNYAGGLNRRPEYHMEMHVATSKATVRSLYPQTVNGKSTDVVFCENGEYCTLNGSYLYTDSQMTDIIQSMIKKGMIGICRNCNKNSNTDISSRIEEGIIGDCRHCKFKDNATAQPADEEPRKKKGETDAIDKTSAPGEG